MGISQLVFAVVGSADKLRNDWMLEM